MKERILEIVAQALGTLVEVALEATFFVSLALAFISAKNSFWVFFGKVYIFLPDTYLNWAALAILSHVILRLLHSRERAKPALKIKKSGGTV